MKIQPAVFKELPLSVLEEDQDQPRRAYKEEFEGVDPSDIAEFDNLEKETLFVSIQQWGIQQPIAVNEVEEGRHIIIDGHRRYQCARKLGMETVPCRVYKGLKEGDFVLIQFQVQNVRKDWKPYERAEALKRIKRVMKLDNNRELSDYVGLSKTVVFSDLQMIEQATPYLEMMAEHKLQRSYRIEFIRLKPKLRKIKDLEVRDIVEILFKKVDCDVINNAKEFRTLRRIFLRAGLNEEHIHIFLTEDDMTVHELDKLTAQSKISLLVENLLNFIGDRLQKGEEKLSTKKELVPCLQARDFLLERFPKKEYKLADYQSSQKDDAKNKAKVS